MQEKEWVSFKRLEGLERKSIEGFESLRECHRVHDMEKECERTKEKEKTVELLAVDMCWIIGLLFKSVIVWFTLAVLG